jgi:uncharacterized protein YyaL (SSP411 family)
MSGSMNKRHVQQKANRLVHEKSPYLLQHAYNPVDWYAWRDEAFEKARLENKPIFLSIGYSTCHWCHVMEKESFEDLEVAGLMNKHFVSVKVDREERPDLDHIYMTVCQMMTGSGGWPLTIVMTPDKEPFFAATYIPKDNRYGRMGMIDLIPRVSHAWLSRKGDVLESASSILKALHGLEKAENGPELDVSIMGEAYKELLKRFDSGWGGFGESPKFPTPHNIFFLLRYWKKNGTLEALHMVEKTLQEMRRGGIYDHIGFGFHRYSTDRRWLVPHFEKMLYDQAMIAIAYLEAFQATGNSFYADTAGEIFTYVLRDMQSPEGGFFSAEDADSEAEEGKFYVWTANEIREVLSGDDAALVMEVFNVGEDGNFRDEAGGRNTGANVLHLTKSLADSGLERKLEGLDQRMEDIRKRLFEARKIRVHPHKDDKVLTDWNGLMIAAFALGAQVLGNEKYAHAASEAAGFILKHMKRSDGRLLHRFRDGDADITANLDDYAFLQWGLLELYEATFAPEYLEAAIELSRVMVDHFWDERGKGFYFAPDDATDLIVRKKEIYDGAIPSGNSVALNSLLRLARLTGKSEFEEVAAAIIRAFSGQIRQVPSGYTHFLCGLNFALGPSWEIAIAGPEGDGYLIDMLRRIRTRFIPCKVVVFRPSNRDSSRIDAVAEFVRGYIPVDGKPTAYICSGYSCKRPVTDIKDLMEALP